MRSTLSLLPALICIILCPSHSLAIPPLPLNFTILDSGEECCGQGRSVDISGNRAIVGAPFENAGEAYIFDVTTGQLLHKLTPSDPTGSALFGGSVAIDGDLAIVGASQRNAAYVFDVNTGQQIRKLTPINDTRFYVTAVDISNGVAVLGMPHTPAAPGSSFTAVGAAFIYDAASGNLRHRIDGPGGFKREFGQDVKIDGQTVAISSPADHQQHDLHVYNANTGQLQWRYGYETTGENFVLKGIDIDGGRIAIGQSDFFMSDINHAVILDRNSGTLLFKVPTYSFNATMDSFTDDSGFSISGNQFAVGTINGAARGTIGAVAVYDLVTRQFQYAVENPFPTAGDSFGISLVLEGNRLIVGAPGEDSLRGLTYVFSIPEPNTATLAMLTMVIAISRRRRVSKEPRVPRPSCPAVS